MMEQAWKDRIIQLDVVESTNDYLKELLKENVVLEGTVVSASEQSKGRGEGGNIWNSQAGKNLTLSLFLRPVFVESNRQFDLNIMVSLCLCDYLADMGIHAQVKWPNDIMVDDSKIAGILIENSLKKGQLEESVLGIGLNVNQIHFPPMANKPVSIQMIKGMHFELKPLVLRLVQKLEDHYGRMSFKRSAQLRADYHEKLYRKGETQSFETKDGLVFRGTILGIEPSGRLVVRTESTEQSHSYGYKEIRFLK